MLRSLRFTYWMVGTAILLWAICLVTYKQHEASDKYRRHRAEYCDTLRASLEQKRACVEEGTSARDYLPWWHILVAWPEGVTVWAIMITGVVIGWQALETKEAADGAKIAAEASLLSARAFINAERPWVLITSQKVPNSEGIFSIQAKNVGRTPASLTSVVNDATFAPAAKDLPEPPVYGTETVYGNPMILLPEESQEVVRVGVDQIYELCETDQTKIDFELLKTSIWLYGYIAYDDLLTTGDSRAHKTKWCFLFSPSDNELKMIPVSNRSYTGRT